jgi:L-ascorbate metabolism protein UlaG (beta-lactamase superfamily)
MSTSHPEQARRGSGREGRTSVRIEWLGQSAFRLTARGARVVIDPFGDMGALGARGMRFDYPPISGVSADLVLVTHEHADHNGVESVSGSPQVFRSTAGTFESPLGEIVAVASEHDDVAGTRRGPNTIFVFSLDGLRICHMGDFGQASLRREQRRAIGEIDVLLLPVGGGPTIGGKQAAEIAGELAPLLIVPMHFQTPAVDFLEPPDEFLARVRGTVRRPGASEVNVDEFIGSRAEPVVVLLQAPSP